MATLYASTRLSGRTSPRLVKRIEAHAFIGGSVSSIISSTTSAIRHLPQADSPSEYDAYLSEISNALITALKSLHKLSPPSPVMGGRRKADLLDHLMSEAIASHLWKLINAILTRINPIVSEVDEEDVYLNSKLDHVAQALHAILEDVLILLPSIVLGSHLAAVNSISPAPSL